MSDPFHVMRALVSRLEHRHRVLRVLCKDDRERQELDVRARSTARLALATIALYEEEPMRERAAIGAMYEACEAGLATLAVLTGLRAHGDLRKTLADTISDLQELISQLFEWLVPLAAPPPARRLEH